MKLLLIIYRLVYGQKPTILLKKSLLVRSKNFKLKEHGLSFIQKLKVFIFFNKLFFKAVLSKNKISENYLVFDFESSPQLRIDFINFFNKTINVNHNNLLGNKISKPNSFVLLFKNWILVNFCLCIWFFIKEKYSDGFLFTALRTFVQLHSLPKNPELVFFLTISPDSYWASLFANKISGATTFNIASSSPLFTFHRYTYLPLNTFVLCGNYQKEELKNYQKNNWVAIKNNILWGLEEEHLIDHDKRILYDIAFFSSAEWIRNENMIRVKNVDLIKDNPQINTKPYLLFKECLSEVIKVKERYKNLKIIFCFHPAEINLIKDHNIYPPFMNDLVSHKIENNLDHSNSIYYYNKINLGISTMSTTTFDLWHLNVNALVFSAVGYNKILQHAGFYDYLPSYKKYCYHSPKQLGEYIIRDLKLI